jgi:cell division protein FtsL
MARASAARATSEPTSGARASARAGSRRAPAGRTSLSDDPIREPRRRLRVVAQRRRWLWLAVISGVVVFAALAALIAVQMQSVTDQQELDSISKRRRELTNYRDRLQLRVDELESPERIVFEAEVIGLVRPTERVRLVPKPEQLDEAVAPRSAPVSVPAVASPAPAPAAAVEVGAADTGDAPDAGTVTP